MYLQNKSSGMNAVEINACWREALKKENHGRVLKTDFDFNPKNLAVVTTKATQPRLMESKDDKATDDML